MTTITIANIGDNFGNPNWSFDGSGFLIGVPGVGIVIGEVSPVDEVNSVNVSGNYYINNTKQATGAAGQLPGTGTNDNAVAGNVGEYAQGTVSGIGMSTGIDTNMATVSLSAGDWDVWGSCLFALTSATVTEIALGVNSIPNAFPSLPDGSATVLPYSFSGTSANTTITCGPKRFSLASTTTIYLVAVVLFSAGTVTGSGLIAARRAR